MTVLLIAEARAPAVKCRGMRVVCTSASVHLDNTDTGGRIPSEWVRDCMGAER